MAHYQLSTDRITWTDIEPDPTVIVYRPYAETVERLNGLRKGLGFGQLEWDWGQTLISGTRLYNLQQFCPAGQAYATVYVRSMVDEVGTAYRRTQKEFRATMSRVRVDQHIMRAGQDWARGIGVVFDELQERPDFERNRGLTLTGFDGVEALAIDADAGILYCGTYPWPLAAGQIARVSLRDMALLTVLTLSPGGNVRTLNLTANKQYLYVGCEESAGNDSVVKIQMSDFTQADRVVLTTAGTIHSAAVDSNGQFGYYVLNNAPWEVCKIRLSDMTHLSTINGGVYGSNDAVLISPDDEYLYVANTTDVVTRIELDSFTVDTSISTGQDPSIMRGIMDRTGTYMYFGSSSSPGSVAAVSLGTFSAATPVALAAGEDQVYGMVIDGNNEYLYIATRGTAAVPSEIIRFQIPGLVRDSSISFRDGEYDIRSLMFDNTRFFGYAGMQNAPGQVVEFGGGT